MMDQRQLVPRTSEAALVPRTSETTLKGALSTLPLSLFLSPNISQDRAAALRDLALAHPRYARLVASEEGALSVLPDFEHEEISALERRRCRIIGLPFAERLLRNPSSLEQVNALPLYDFILSPTSTVCHSGLLAPVKLRCSVLAKWMGARISETMDFNSGLLVTTRVSLHPKSKYQEALAHRVPIVKPSFLESSWSAKEHANIEQHALPALQGLGVCFDPRHADIIDKYKSKLTEHGAVIEQLDRAEVVIVKDKFSPLYEDAKNIGLLTAPPLWLDRCFQLRGCVPIQGELVVPKTQTSALVAPGQSLGAFGDLETFQRECHGALLGCVLCLLYLAEGHDRNYAKALAWKCGAFTTLDPHDRAITHVLLKVSGKVALNVSLPIDDDRISFLDIGWLESCIREGRRVPEKPFVQTMVAYNPVLDTSHNAILGRNVATPMMGHARSRQSLQKTASIAPDPKLSGLVPLADAAPSKSSTPAPKPIVSMPTSDEGTFKGLKLGLYSGQSAQSLETERLLVEQICTQAGVAVRGSPETLLGSRLNVCICCDVCKPPPLALQQSAVKLATPAWVSACVADGFQHSRTSFAHFKPCCGDLPIGDMKSCAIRLTAVEPSSQSQRKRARLEELVQLLGGRVVDATAKWSEITHIVCVVPELVEPKTYESACKRNKPMVTVKWLFDCFEKCSRQPEERYFIKSVHAVPDSPVAMETSPVTTMQRSFAVLAAYSVFISPASLGSDDKLPGRAEELGAKVHTWRTADELKTILAARGVSSEAQTGNGVQAAPGNASTDLNIVVLVEKDEVGGANSALASFIGALTLAHRNMFVLPAWLAETFSQRRCLPLEAFAAVPNADAEAQASKRQRTGEATYAWQTEATAHLAKLAQDSQAEAMRSKQQQKVTEGLRLAKLHREGSGSGART